MVNTSNVLNITGDSNDFGQFYHHTFLEWWGVLHCNLDHHLSKINQSKKQGQYQEFYLGLNGNLLKLLKLCRRFWCGSITVWLSSKIKIALKIDLENSETQTKGLCWREAHFLHCLKKWILLKYYVSHEQKWNWTHSEGIKVKTTCLGEPADQRWTFNLSSSSFVSLRTVLLYQWK